jgi:hypothetical protein
VPVLAHFRRGFFALAIVLVAAPVACSRGDHPPVAGGPAATGTTPVGVDAAPIAQALPSRIVAGPVVSSPAGLYEFEPDVAVGTTGVVAATFIAGGPGTIGYTFSLDDGLTWTAPQAILPAPNARNVDPALASDGAGGFALVWLEQGASSRKVFASVAPAGSTVFGAPVEVTDPGAPAAYDKPWVTVLADGTTVIVLTTDTGSAVTVARSRGGAAFTRATLAPDGTLRAVAYPCASQARLFVTYLVPGGIALSASDDGGATWTAAATTLVQAKGEHTAFDMPTCAADGDDVWIAYGTTQDTNVVTRADRLDAIRVARSTDGGRTIAAHALAGDSALAMHPRLVRDATGTLHLLYYGGKAEGDRAAALHHVRSLDKGATWTASEQVGLPSTFVVARTGLDWLGDYVGAATKAGHVYTTYVQNQFDGGSISHVAFARVDPP